jgi:hypothetical protein
VLEFYHNPSFWESLFLIDKKIAKEFQSSNKCKRCHKKLHSDNYVRKPRGLPIEAEKYFQFRFSFKCSSCRKRSTCPTVRFSGQKVYVSMLVSLIPSEDPRTKAMMSELNNQLPTLAKITIKRWSKWWVMLPQSSAWKLIEGSVPVNVNMKFLPDFLIDKFGRTTRSWINTYKAFLKFLTPIMTPINYLTTVRIIQ